MIADLDELENENVRTLKRLILYVLKGVSVSLGLPPDGLTHPPLTNISLKSEIAQGQLRLEECRLINQEMTANAVGGVQLADELPQSVIQNIPIQIGLSTNVAKRAKVYREDRVQGAYAVPPPFVRLTGTLGAPKVSIDKKVLSGLVLSGVLERNKIGDEQTQEILRGLGGLLSGEGPPPKPTPTEEPQDTSPDGDEAKPTPTPKPSDVEKVFNILQGFRK